MTHTILEIDLAAGTETQREMTHDEISELLASGSTPEPKEETDPE